jgi:hypothetical protein
VSARSLAKTTAGLIGKKSLVCEVKKKSKYGKKEEWILIFEKQLERINRIVRIERPSAKAPLAAGEKNPFNPVNPV